jgi:hypothetical protein
VYPGWRQGPAHGGAAANGPANGGTSFFNGLLDELEIFNRVLTAAEVKAIFAAGSAGKCKP